MIINIDALLPEETGLYYYDNEKKIFSKYTYNHELPLLATSSSLASASASASAPINTNYNNRINHISTTISYE